MSLQYKFNSFLISMLIYTCVNSQIDLESTYNNGQFVSDSSLNGTWLTKEGGEYQISSDHQGTHLVQTNDRSDSIAFIRSDLNVLTSINPGSKMSSLVLNSFTDITLITYKNNAFLSSMQLTRSNKEVIVVNEKKEKSIYVLYYPSLNSLVGFNVGLVNKKWNFYAGFKLSNFLFESSDLSNECNGHTFVNTGTETAASRDVSDVGHSYVVIGLTNQIIEKYLKVHYGIGVGNYKVYRGFDIWNLDLVQEQWIYEKSVWANDLDEELTGVQIEAGVIVDVGVLISLGFNSINFSKYDVMLGVGYAF